MRAMRPWSIPLALALVLPAPGCCSCARLFCGPDRTPWISIDYTTPQAAARTLLEALRRDDPEVVYASMSQACRKRLELDRATLVVAWPKVRAENPGLHVVGYAEVPAPKILGPDQARLELLIEGRRVDLDVVRQRRWEVRYRRTNGTLADPGGQLASFATQATLSEAETDNGTVVTLGLLPLVFPVGFHSLALEQIESAGLCSEWKVDRITVHADG